MIDPQNCCGCGTCTLVCPQNCITIDLDAKGFTFAKVDSDSCIDCHRCEQVCPMLNPGGGANVEHDRPVFASYSKDEDVHHRGSSGGMFETLAEPIISSGGLVFGCRFDENLQLKYFSASNMEDVRRLCKSKYIQGDLGDAFIQIENALDDGKKVLFCGTPCYVAALKNFLKGKNLSNLFLVDFFCHGVPSQSFFNKCRNYVEKKKHVEIESYEFRVKKKYVYTLHNYHISYRKSLREEGKVDRIHTKDKTRVYVFDPFYLAFQKYLTLRESCYLCKYGNGNHQADVTIGDFHEINDYVPRRQADKLSGVSTVIINNEKGENLFNQIRNNIWLHSFAEKQLMNDRQIWQGATKKPSSYDAFWKDYSSIPFSRLVHKWLNPRHEWYKVVYYHLPRPFRTVLKRIVIG